MQKKLALYLALSISLFFVAQPAKAGLTNAVYWSFGAAGSGGTLSPTSNSWSGLTVANWGIGNSNAPNSVLAPNSVSSTYTTAAGFGASGATNTQLAIVNGALNTATSTYFSTALTLSFSSPIMLTVTNVSFGSRATGTGPTAFSLYASTDGFISNFQQLGSTQTGLANSAYAAQQFAALAFDINPGDTISFRLYGSSGTGGSSSSNWRVDDFAIALSDAIVPAPVPEPSTLVLATLGGMACWFAVRRKH